MAAELSERVRMDVATRNVVKTPRIITLLRCRHSREFLSSLFDTSILKDPSNKIYKSNTSFTYWHESVHKSSKSSGFIFFYISHCLSALHRFLPVEASVQTRTEEHKSKTDAFHTLLKLIDTSLNSSKFNDALSKRDFSSGPVAAFYKLLLTDLKKTMASVEDPMQEKHLRGFITSLAQNQPLVPLYSFSLVQTLVTALSPFDRLFALVSDQLLGCSLMLHCSDVGLSLS